MSSQENDRQLDELVKNPGFRMAMKNARGSFTPLPISVLRCLVLDDHFPLLIHEITGEKLGFKFEQKHFDLLADDARISFLLQELLEKHLRLRDRVKNAASWIVDIFRKWIEKVLEVSHSQNPSQPNSPVRPRHQKPRSELATVIITLLAGGGAFISYQTAKSIEQEKVIYQQEISFIRNEQEKMREDLIRFQEALNRQKQDFERHRAIVNAQIRNLSNDPNKKLDQKTDLLETAQEKRREQELEVINKLVALLDIHLNDDRMLLQNIAVQPARTHCCIINTTDKDSSTIDSSEFFGCCCKGSLNRSQGLSSTSQIVNSMAEKHPWNNEFCLDQ